MENGVKGGKLWEHNWRLRISFGLRDHCAYTLVNVGRGKRGIWKAWYFFFEVKDLLEVE